MNEMTLPDFTGLEKALANDLDRILGSLSGPFLGLGGLARPEFVETDASFIITVDVPGYSKEELAVEVKDGFLTVKGPQKGRRSASHTIEVGGLVDATKIEATLKDGVLTITAPKSENIKQRTIAVS